MKKAKYSAYFLLFVCTMIVTGLLVSCKDDDNNTTSSKVELLSFGPCPIPRGAALRIIGKNLDKVESVTLPGCGAISDIMRISSTEINVTVPKTAESGKIVLTAGDQQITSLSNLSIDGIIALTGFSPLTAKAGDIIKIEGEDLDFVKEVIFANDIHVVKDSFVSNTLTAIEVKVPLVAQSGKIAVSDGADTPIIAYFDDNFNVVLPTITSFSPETIKAGTVLTITGKDFDLVNKVTFGGNKMPDVFTVNNEKTSITVTVPTDAADGPVVLTAFSGVTVSSATDLVMLVPTITSIAPTSVYADDTVKITGTDLDLVSAISFGGGKQPAQMVPGGTATEIKVLVPGNAKDGTIILTTLANKTVESTESLTIQVKGGATETVVFQGPVSLTWNDGGRAYVAASDLANVPAGSILVIYFTQTDNWGQAQINDGSWAAVTGLGNNGYLKTDEVGDKTVTSFESVLTQDILDLLQAHAGATSDFLGGTEPAAIIIQGQDWIIDKITVKVPITEKVLYQGPVSLTWDDSGRAVVAASDLEGVAAGSILTIYFTQTANWGQAQINDGQWGAINALGINGYLKTDEVGDKSVTSYDNVLTQDVLDLLQANKGIYGYYSTTEPAAIIIQGSDWIIDKITVK